jgi:hypothetical protein
MMRRTKASILFTFLAASCAAGGGHEHGGADVADARVAVHFPEPLRAHTLANMRDHLATLQAIQEALALAQYDRAAGLAETRLGLTSLEAHGAHEVAKYMPAAMQEIGTGMHKAASRFGIAAANAGATGDLKGAVEALSAVTAQCVACHAAYRLE